MDSNNSFTFTIRLTPPKKKKQPYFSYIKVTLRIQVVMIINLFCHVKKHPVLSYFKFNRKKLQLQKYMSKYLYKKTKEKIQTYLILVHQFLSLN